MLHTGLSVMAFARVAMVVPLAPSPRLKPGDSSVARRLPEVGTPSRFPASSCFTGRLVPYPYAGFHRPLGGEARSSRQFVSEHQASALEHDLRRVHVRLLRVAALDATKKIARHPGPPARPILTMGQTPKNHHAAW